MTNGRQPIPQTLFTFGWRAARTATRPFVGGAAAAAGAGMDLERQLFVRALDRIPLDELLEHTINHPQVQAAVSAALDSAGAKQLVRTFFSSGLFDELVNELLQSKALWRLVDEVADSPAVTAAITQQGLGFADQVGEEVRERSRNADDWLERVALRLIHRRQRAGPVAAETPTPGIP